MQYNSLAYQDRTVITSRQELVLVNKGYRCLANLRALRQNYVTGARVAKRPVIPYGQTFKIFGQIGEKGFGYGQSTSKSQIHVL